MLNKRRVIMMLGAFVLGLIFCSFATAEVFSSYQAARAATVKNKKPLVVLITASWWSTWMSTWIRWHVRS